MPNKHFIQEHLFSVQRPRPSFELGLRAVDLFAGAGGFTEGATRAGVHVVWAANHCPQAVEVHKSNHPETAHACQDLRQADFSQLPEFEILLASPACQGHSTASQPRRRAKHDADRSTAWAVIDCLETCRPRAFAVENVPSFTRWPLYALWCSALETLGYRVSIHVLDAADFGVPQNRQRLFVTGFFDKTEAPSLEFRRQEPRGAKAILDPKADAWQPLASKPDGVQARVRRGRRRLGDRFLTQHVTNHPGRSLDRPIGTVTCVSGHWHLVERDQIRALTVRELARAQGFDDSFWLPDQCKLGTRLVGNAVPPPLAKAVVEAVARPLI